MKRAASSAASRSKRSHGNSAAKDSSDIQQETVERRKDAKLRKKSTEDLPPNIEVHCTKERSTTKNHGQTRTKWSREEDKKLVQLVNKHGANSWETVACALPGRSAPQCKIRWQYSVNPAINKGAWTLREELKLIVAHQVYGDKWIKMIKHFPGRTNHGLRQYWRRHLKGKLNSYLSSGLLEQIPDLHNAQASGPQSTHSDVPKDTEVLPADTGRSSVLQQSSKSKRDITKLGGHADTTEGNSSNDFIHRQSLDVRPVKFSERIVSKSQQQARARRKLDLLSTPVCTAAATPAISQMPTSRREQLSPSACNASSQNVVSECVDTILSTAAGENTVDAHSSLTQDQFSLEQYHDYQSDLLDMSYCDSMMIDPPSPPRDNGFM